MDELLKVVGDLGTLLRSAAVLAGAVIVLAVLQRLLNRGEGSAPGRRFRNQLITFSATLVVLLLVILGLPLDPQTRGQLLSLFGIVVSATIALGSSTLLGNAMAGIMLKLVRNFRPGDFVFVGDHFGRVSERGLFHTEIQTPDRDLTTLPNLFLATTPVQVVRSSGTVVSATVSLGYDVHHTRVEELLVAAVKEAGLADPFVQVLELGDFSVTYKAAGLLVDVKTLLAARSRLRTAMLDALHGGGVEILSPDFRSVRAFDAGRTFVPERPAGPAPAAAPEAAPAEVVFDKAEEAETLESLAQRREALVQQLKEAEHGDGEHDRRRAELLKARLEHLDETLAARRRHHDDGD